MAESAPLPIRVAQTLGITSSAFLAGNVLSFSYVLVPRLLQSPTSLMVQQWEQAYQSGKKSARPFALLSCASYLYLAYRVRAAALATTTTTGALSAAVKSKVLSYVLAGSLVFSITLYTPLVMGWTNRQLLAKAQQAKDQASEATINDLGFAMRGMTAHELLDIWGVQNFGRGLLVVAGAVIGTWTALN